MVSDGAASIPSGSQWLQWSHVFSDMVSAVPDPDDHRLWRLQWSHVFSDMVRAARSVVNVSGRAKLQWSHVFSDMVRRSRPRSSSSNTKTASMEPCLFRHGKRMRALAMRCDMSRLQWSHVFSDMVSQNPYHNSHCRTALQWSHVFSDMVRDYKLIYESHPWGCFNGAMSFQTW